MEIQEAIDFLHNKFGTHSRVALHIGYTPEYYNFLRSTLKKNGTIPASAKSRILLQAAVFRIHASNLSQSLPTATV